MDTERIDIEFKMYEILDQIRILAAEIDRLALDAEILFTNMITEAHDEERYNSRYF